MSDPNRPPPDPAIVVTQPPWVLLFPTPLPDPAGECIALFGFRLPDGTEGRYAAVFSTTDQVARFCESVGDAARGMQARQLRAAASLGPVLQNLRVDGATHVSFDATADAPNPVPLDEFLARLRT